MFEVQGRARQTLLAALLAAIFVFALGAANAWASDYDGDGVSTPTDCDDFDRGIRPGAADKPDLQFEDSNCDGIDGTEANAIFVAASAANDAGTGSKENPLKTLALAISQAKAATPDKDVYLITGTFDQGTVNLESGVSLYGGYKLVTGQRSNTEPTLIKGRPQALLANADTDVVVQKLTLEGLAPAGASSSAYGLRAVAASEVLLQGVHIFSRNATAAPNRSQPGQPGRAPDGDPGTGGQSCGASGNVGGGAGGSALGVQGGTGGFGGGSSFFLGGQGDPGGGTQGGTGGPGGERTGNVGGNGTGGGAGGTLGIFGIGTTGGSPSFSTVAAAAGWAGRDGGGGGIGSRGHGGGGGGGGASGWGDEGNATWDGGGGGGGGGGAGGFGGSGGSGGGYGGGSFGVYSHNSKVMVVDSALTTGNGGRGGDGAIGALGGQGGLGGDPGPEGFCPGPPVGNGGAGGRGGSGGVGSPGGPGGGGTGGPSIAVLSLGTATHFVRGTNSTLGTAGLGGFQGGSGSVRGGAGQRSAVVGTTSNLQNFDGDGVPDRNDLCPGVAATTDANHDGCQDRAARLTDADGDGIPAPADRCPNTPRGNDPDGDGCPAVVVTAAAAGGAPAASADRGAELHRVHLRLRVPEVDEQVHEVQHPPVEGPAGAVDREGDLQGAQGEEVPGRQVVLEVERLRHREPEEVEEQEAAGRDQAHGDGHEGRQLHRQRQGLHGAQEEGAEDLDEVPAARRNEGGELLARQPGHQGSAPREPRGPSGPRGSRALSFTREPL